jgi:hypothetical protein
MIMIDRTDELQALRRLLRVEAHTELRDHLREHLEPLAIAGVQADADFGLPKLGAACRRLLEAMDGAAPIAEIVDLAMLVSWFLGQASAKTHGKKVPPRRYSGRVPAAARRSGPDPRILFNTVAELEARGRKGDNLVRELQHRTGASESTARRAVRGWRDLKKEGGVSGIFELDVDGNQVFTPIWR